MNVHICRILSKERGYNLLKDYLYGEGTIANWR